MCSTSEAGGASWTVAPIFYKGWLRSQHQILEVLQWFSCSQQTTIGVCVHVPPSHSPIYPHHHCFFFPLLLGAELPAPLVSVATIEAISFVLLDACSFPPSPIAFVIVCRTTGSHLGLPGLSPCTLLLKSRKSASPGNARFCRFSPVLLDSRSSGCQQLCGIEYLLMLQLPGVLAFQ